MSRNSSSHRLNDDFEPVDVKSLANLILDWADELGASITPMKLQKLVYYCHADFLVATGAPLIRQEFEAWKYGPVVPSLFQEFKSNGAAPICTRAFRFDPISCSREEAAPCNLGQTEPIVRETFTAYVRHTASVLSNMSHSEEGPWAEALRRFGAGSAQGRSIENHVIARHHKRPIRQTVH